MAAGWAAIRAVKRFRDLPVVLVTGLESERDRARGIDAGANAYLLKSAGLLVVSFSPLAPQANGQNATSEP